MNIIVCGAGQVGSHVSDVLATAGHNITVIDKDPQRLSAIADALDVATLCGNCATAEVLRRAEAHAASLVIAATESDEVNLLCGSVAKALGAGSTIVRVHHQTFFQQRGLDYSRHLDIDHLICPEHSTALAIASTLRNPGALAIENFAKGQIEMQEFEAGAGAPGLDKRLSTVSLPSGVRLAAISRSGEAFLPAADSVVSAGDRVVLVGNAETFSQAKKLFQTEKTKRRKVVLMGGPAMAVWLSRALHSREYAIRLFEIDRDRAEVLADKLDWVTVICADPTDQDVAEEEHFDQVDVFVAMTGDDEHNIIGGATAKHMGAREAIAVVRKPTLWRLVESVGIDRSYSPRTVAAKEIIRFIDTGPIRHIASLAEGFIEVYWVRVGAKAEVVGKPLRDLKLSPNWVVACVQHGPDVAVPGAGQILQAGDAALVIGRHGQEKHLRRLFTAGS
ncbi:MAG: Trk system potassium transporter TrkA [Planctomycetes bacterium]|nr:Trk system potassium transporter TrkA [Planctomycetota bacterium]